MKCIDRSIVAASVLVLLAPLATRAAGQATLASWLVREDGLIESLGAVACLAAGVSFLLAAALGGPAAQARPRWARTWYLLLAVGALLMFAEEISWGQRLLEFGTPGWMSGWNNAGEFNFHNLNVFQREADSNHLQTLWMAWCLGYFGLLPPAVALWPTVRRRVERLGIPLPSPALCAVNWAATLVALTPAIWGRQWDPVLVNQEVIEGYEGVAELLLLGVALRALADARARRGAAARGVVTAAGLTLAALAVIVALWQFAGLDGDRMQSQVLVMHGNYFLSAGRTQEALEAWNEAARLWPENAAAHEKRGAHHLQAGQYAAAHDALLALAKLQPDSFTAHYGLGVAALMSGRLAEAQTHLERAVRLSPTALEPRVNLALVYEHRGRHAEAAAELKQVLARDPTHPMAHLALGKIYLAQDRRDEARPHLERALESQPHRVEALANLAALAARQGDVALAARRFDEALAIEPQRYDVLLSAGAFHLERHEPARAAALVERLQALAPDEPQVLYLLGRLRLLEDRPTEAVGFLQHAVQQAPGLIDAHFRLGLALEKLEEPQRARLHYRQAVALDPRHGPAREQLARIEKALASPQPAEPGRQ